MPIILSSPPLLVTLSICACRALWSVLACWSSWLSLLISCWCCFSRHCLSFCRSVRSFRQEITQREITSLKVPRKELICIQNEKTLIKKTKSNFNEFFSFFDKRQPTLWCCLSSSLTRCWCCSLQLSAFFLSHFSSSCSCFSFCSAPDA